MQTWQYLLLAGLAVLLLALLVWSALRKSRERKERDFTRRLETLLLPKETVKQICPDRKGRWVLTSRRLILEAGEGFTAIPYDRIKKVTGEDPEGKATVAAGKMQLLHVHFEDRIFTLRRKQDDFTDLVKLLRAEVSAAKKKKK